MIYRVFTESSQAPFFDLQGFYIVKSGPLCRFTGFLHSQVRPPFIIYRVFTESSQAPFFDLQGFYRVKPGPFSDLQGFYKVKSGPLCPPFSIYRRFTANCFVEFLGFSSIFLHVVYMIF